jgi:hypothetical protein
MPLPSQLVLLGYVVAPLNETMRADFFGGRVTQSVNSVVVLVMDEWTLTESCFG